MSDNQLTDLAAKIGHYESIGWDAAADRLREEHEGGDASTSDTGSMSDAPVSVVDLSAEDRDKLTDLDARLARYVKNGHDSAAGMERTRRARLFDADSPFPDYDEKIDRYEEMGWDSAADQVRARRAKLAETE